MKPNKLKISISIFSLLLCFGVFAQGPPGGGQGGRSGGGQGQQRGGSQPNASEILSKLDTNNDSKISESEASKDRRGKIAEDFDEIDSNNDSFIDLNELKDSLGNRSSKRQPKKVSAKKIIKEVDDNGDETLNELEVAAEKKRDLIKNFNTIDTNQDNELDLEELKVFYDKNDKSKPKERGSKKSRK